MGGSWLTNLSCPSIPRSCARTRRWGSSLVAGFSALWDRDNSLKRGQMKKRDWKHYLLPSFGCNKKINCIVVCAHAWWLFLRILVPVTCGVSILNRTLRSRSRVTSWHSSSITSTCTRGWKTQQKGRGELCSSSMIFLQSAGQWGYFADDSSIFRKKHISFVHPFSLFHGKMFNLCCL